MTSPSLLANPIMGLTGARPLARDLLAHHRHVYFSDLREVSASGLSLAGRLFYGCVVSAETFTGAVLDGSRFVCCVGRGEPWPDDDVRRAVHEGLLGDWRRAWALLESPAGLAQEALERLVAVSAIGLLDARWGGRLDTMTCIAQFLQRHPAVLSPATRQVIEAFLLYRTADKSDMVNYDAARLVDDLQVSRGALEHLVGRARSLDPQERRAALVARYRIQYTDRMSPYPPLGELLDDDDPDVQLELLGFLSQCVRYSWDVKKLLPGVDLPAKLNRFLRSPDERIRRRAVSYTRDHGNESNREALVCILWGSDEMLRDAAFDALCRTLYGEELHAFLVEHEATPAQRARILEYERRWREQFAGSDYLIETEDLDAMLTSDDPRRRHDALVLVGYIGNPAHTPHAERALGDEDPRVRAEAERALRLLREAQDQVRAGDPARSTRLGGLPPGKEA
jgi:HEAT repeat protein